MIAILAPGQGAQTPGMLSPWLELDGVAEQLGRYSEIVGLDLVRLGTTADADDIKDTAVTQPLIVAAGLVVASRLSYGEVIAAGHSIGEVTAASVSGALTADDAIAFAGRRGAAMARACAVTPTSMAAVLGGDQDDVAAAIEAAGLVAANRNAAGQIVAAGSAEAIADLVANPPAGSRVRPLAVAGAFHTSYMAPAEAEMRSFATSIAALDPRPILLSNADGTAVTTGASVLDRLVSQVTRPVRWDLCLDTMRDVGVTAAIELAPAGTLVGIAKRELPGVELLAIKTPDDLAAAQTLIDAHPDFAHGHDLAELRVVVTPNKGVFTRNTELDEGSPVRAGARIGTIRTNRDEFAVVSAGTGILTEWLKSDGDIVAAGLPVALLAQGSDA